MEKILKKLLLSLAIVTTSLSASVFANPVDGDWENGKCQPTLNYGGGFKKVYFTVNSEENEISVATLMYRDRNCKKKLFEHEITASLDADSPENRKSDFVFEFENQTITPLNKRFARQLKLSNACLRRNWKKNRATSVSGRYCFKTLFAVNGTELDGNYKVNKKGKRLKITIEGNGAVHNFNLKRSK